MSIWARFLTNEDGATSIEYALIAAGIAVAIATTITSLGSTVKASYTLVSTTLK
jgi:pilus assembly protein Flp/PilA